jgi:transcriptional regulator with AAA-type ATPase domain
MVAKQLVRAFDAATSTRFALPMLLRMSDIDADTHEDSPASQRDALLCLQPYLFVALECDRPTAGGARFSLRGVDEVVIGRGSLRAGSRQTDGGVRRLFVRVPGRSMSSAHARLRNVGNEWVLEDAKSTNGSFVNGDRVERGIVRDGDVIELGHTLFVLRTALPTPVGTPLELDSAEFEPRFGFATLIPEERSRFEDLDRIASSGLPILLRGETGTGKEVLARTIHELSRREGKYIALNCGAIPPLLVESHLFGHVRGAFSGAMRDELGAIRAADGGTLLLDEIGDLPVTAQPALLRFLQEREVTPVGSYQAQRVDVRIISATHQPLERMVEKRTFRSDLLARLNGLTYRLRPLRDRREDLGVIIASLMGKHGASSVDLTIAPAAGRRLLTADWPWNVRQLEQVLVRTLALSRGTISTKDVVDAIDSQERHHPATSEEREAVCSSQAAGPLSEADLSLRKELLGQLERHNGNIAAVAKTMGKARMQIHRWMRRFDIEPNSFRNRVKW